MTNDPSTISWLPGDRNNWFLTLKHLKAQLMYTIISASTRWKALVEQFQQDLCTAHKNEGQIYVEKKKPCVNSTWRESVGKNWTKKWNFNSTMKYKNIEWITRWGFLGNIDQVTLDSHMSSVRDPYKATVEIIFMKGLSKYVHHIHCGSVLWRLLVNVTVNDTHIPPCLSFNNHSTSHLRSFSWYNNIYYWKKYNILWRLNLGPKLRHSLFSWCLITTVKKWGLCECNSHVSHLSSWSNLNHICNVDDQMW